MKCSKCGNESSVSWKACPVCGWAPSLAPAAVGPPGTAGPAMANGSDEVRNSKESKPDHPKPELANPGRPPGEIVEGAGG
jgi:hypothetical protein